MMSAQKTPFNLSREQVGIIVAALTEAKEKFIKAGESSEMKKMEEALGGFAKQFGISHEFSVSNYPDKIDAIIKELKPPVTRGRGSLIID